MKNTREEREKGYVERVQADRSLHGCHEITPENVLAGLKFIARNQSLSQDELIDGLLELGCNYTLEDLEKQFPYSSKKKLFKGMKKGDISSGASVIINVRDSEWGRAYVADRFLSSDDNTSVYHFIRVVTRKLKVQKRVNEILGFSS